MNIKVKSKFINPLLMILFLAFFSSQTKAAPSPTGSPVYDAKLFRQVDACAPHSAASTMVYLLKQWHLPPQVNTKIAAKGAPPLPQAKNQEQIYLQLSEWIDQSTIDTVIAEGCEGEMNANFKDAFQGWTYSDLAEKTKSDDYSKIMAHPVLKVEAKYGAAVHSYCGDKLGQIKKAQNALSDARAGVGYYSRLNEYQNQPEKLKSYLEGAREAYSLPKTAGTKEVMSAIGRDLKQNLATFQNSLHERDLAFAQRAADAQSKKPVAIVIGGLHTQDLKKILEQKKMNCVIFEPLAYENDEESLQEQLRNALKKF